VHHVGFTMLICTVAIISDFNVFVLHFLPLLRTSDKSFLLAEFCVLRNVDLCKNGWNFVCPFATQRSLRTVDLYFLLNPVGKKAVFSSETLKNSHFSALFGQYLSASPVGWGKMFGPSVLYFTHFTVVCRAVFLLRFLNSVIMCWILIWRYSSRSDMSEDIPPLPIRFRDVFRGKRYFIHGDFEVCETLF
jgi:hypothetical protein